MSETTAGITPLLNHLGEGDSSAEDALISYVYAELHRVAAGFLRAERRDHTLQPTILVHDVYLRLCRMENPAWRDRGHFFRTAARMMRRILIDYARRHSAQKRYAPVVSLDDVDVAAPEKRASLLEVDDALKELAEINPRQAEVVQMRFFGGLSESEIAEALDVNRRTVIRDWAKAQAWLHQRLRRF